MSGQPRATHVRAATHHTCKDSHWPHMSWQPLATHVRAATRHTCQGSHSPHMPRQPLATHVRAGIRHTCQGSHSPHVSGQPLATHAKTASRHTCQGSYSPHMSGQPFSRPLVSAGIDGWNRKQIPNLQKMFFVEKYLYDSSYVWRVLTMGHDCGIIIARSGLASADRRGLLHRKFRLCHGSVCQTHIVTLFYYQRPECVYIDASMLQKVSFKNSRNTQATSHIPWQIP